MIRSPIFQKSDPPKKKKRKRCLLCYYFVWWVIGYVPCTVFISPSSAFGYICMKIPHCLRATTDICDSHSRMPHNSKSRFCGIFPVCELKAMPQSCGTAASDACEKDRTGPILCSMRRCCSQLQLRQQPVQTSDKMLDCAELSNSKMARQTDLC